MSKTKNCKRKVHFTFMPGEIASELCQDVQCYDVMSSDICLVTCERCLDELVRRAESSDEARLKRNLEHVMDVLGWVVDTLKLRHMNRRGIPKIIREVDKRMMPSNDDGLHVYSGSPCVGKTGIKA